MDVADVLAAARNIASAGDNISYPSGSASRHIRSVIRNLIKALEEARPTKVDFVEIAKDHVFSLEEAEQRKRWALEFVPKIAGVARGLGYGIFHGGTLIRDIDLIAMPWRDGPEALPHLDFVFGLIHSLNLQMGQPRRNPVWAPLVRSVG